MKRRSAGRSHHSFRAVSLFGLIVTALATSFLLPASAWAQAAREPRVPARMIGSWSPPVDVGVVGIHAALLHTGKVLLYQYPDTGPNSIAALFDPVTGNATRVDPPFPRDIFCSGLSVMADGRLLVIGGMDDSVTTTDSAGIAAAEIFDPTSETWADAAPMSFARYYPSLVEMPDGTMLALSGDDETGQNIQLAVESYDLKSGRWTTLPALANLPNDEDLYPRMAVLHGGKLFQAGPTQDTILFDPSAMSWSFVANMHQARFGGGAVLLPGLKRVLASGGEITRSAEIIDFSDPNPAWKSVAPMFFSRVELNLVLLADGTVLAVGGGVTPSGDYRNPVRRAELFNPANGRWTLMAQQKAQRTYHSTALLLPDGRVISAGSDSGPLATTIEIFSPPYLFKTARPTISSAPDSVGYGQPFVIATPDAASIKRVAMVRPGAATHANNFDQRYVDLQFTVGSGRLIATAPSSANDAPPGYYMLFIINSSVPAVARFIHSG